MPSKHRKTLNKRKERYLENSETLKRQAADRYEVNKDAVIERSKCRMQTDETAQKKNAAQVKRRLLDDPDYAAENQKRAKLSQKRRLETNEAYRLAKQTRAKENQKRRLQTNEAYRLANQTRAKENQKRRLQTNEAYRLANQTRAKENQKRRLQTNEAYRLAKQTRAKENQKTRLENNKQYREKKQQQAKINKQSRLKTSEDYRQKQRAWNRHNMRTKRQNETCADSNRQRSRMIYAQVHLTDSYRERHRIYVRCSRNAEYSKAPPELRRQLRKKRMNTRTLSSTSSTRLTEQQKYWLRRRRLLTVLKRRTQRRAMQQKMQSESGASAFDVNLLFNKAEQRIRSTTATVRHLHNKLAGKASECLNYIPTDGSASESDISTAFEGTRLHTLSGEPYFWQQSSRLLPSSMTIPVDTRGRAHIFQTPAEASLTDTSAQTDGDQDKSENRWLCNADVCSITSSQINGTIKLLQALANSYPVNITEFYININKCSNDRYNNRCGHSIHCSTETQCTGMLHPARTLSCHYPYLRSLIRRIYETRQISLCIRAVDQAMSSGSFSKLEEAIKVLDETVERVTHSGTTKQDSDETTEATRPPVTEAAVLEQFGPALRQVAEQRDTYTTSSCDVCEELRKDLKKLSSYQNTKGFDSEKMETIIEQLYRNKTQYEDIEQFLDSTLICRYCADKLRSNKEVARSCFNQLAVIPTPDCISNLNLFERSLIKFCMTCITVIRLGQVTNNKRPQNELTAAMKGRIAYLPVDVAANASFLPENLLNVDSLVLLVAGQPTKNNKVWTSVVDLRKVHTALQWLRENNHFYKDVPAYSVDELQEIIQQKLQASDSTLETDTDGVLLKKLNDAAKTALYENFSIQPISGSFPADSIVDYQISKLQGQNINIFDNDLDVKAYPELYPTGHNGMRDANRTITIGTSDFIRNRLLNKNPKFRLNLNYIFHCFQVQEISNMCHSVGHMLRTVSGNSLTAQSFLERLKNRDGELHSKLFSLMSTMRGTKEYYNKLGMDIRWMIRQLGPPTLFITCSMAEWYSEPLLNYIRSVNSTVAGIEDMTPGELCAMDPVSVTIHLKQKWEAIFKNLIKNKDNPIFGEVQDSVTRLEYQNRGAGHFHSLLWIKDAPILGKNSVQEVQQYINKIITCAKPNPKTSPTLHDLVTRFQVHKCNKYCMKSYKKGGKFFKKCRFGYPRPVKPLTDINDVIDCLASGRSKQPRKRLYNIARNADETMINDYNPALLLANAANIDVQYIGHTGSRLPYYISDYMTKGERSEQDQMWQDIFSSAKSLGTNAMAFLLKSVRSRQVGAHEAVDRLLGHKLYTKSRQMRFADLQPPHKVKRVLKTADDISRLLESNPNTADIFQPHWVLDVYPDRPDELEHCCLYDLLGWYERQKNTGNKSENLKLKHLNFHLRKRTKTPYIVTHQIINPNLNDENKETYHYFLLKLFKPWRSESDLCLPGKTYFETYIVESQNLPDMVNYHEQTLNMSKMDAEQEKAVRERADQQRDAEAGEENAEDEAAAFNGCAVDHVQTAMSELKDCHKNNKTLETADSLYSTLNTDQRRIVDKVHAAICQDDEPIRLIVSGQGGTGKSQVIKALNSKISQELDSELTVIVTAPTGLAAYNVHGITIHRALCLPVEHGKPSDYNRLSQEQLTTIRATLKNLKLLIIDEVSMVSSITLLYIHLRLTEIMSTDDYFGRINIVFFADFLQLPPVKGNQPFIPVTYLEAKQRIGAIASIDLWQTFQYEELTVNMRQSGDKRYAEVLSQIRVGQVTNEVYKCLTERLISPGHRASVSEVCDRYTQLVDNGSNPLILLPRTALCNDVNAAMLKRTGNATYSLPAIDTLDTLVDNKILPKVQKAYHKTEDDTTRTAGLEKELQLSVGARVMLRRNLDVDAGLVNGSVGTVVGFKSTGTDIHSVSITFNNIARNINIQRESCSFEVLKGVFYTRKQFPIMLAFAITIHKSQGLSLQSVIVDVGPSTFGCGMAYVALSRVTSLQGLHLIDIDRAKIKCDQKAIREYNRLRQLYTPHLGIIETQSPPTTTEQQSIYQDCDIEHPVPQQPDCAEQVDVIHTGTEQHNIYQYCHVTSLDEEFQRRTCERLNLKLYKSRMQTVHGDAALSQSLQQQIKTKTGQNIDVTLHRIVGDGNCLFRALSLAMTRSQRQHALVRSYVVNHMMADSVSGPMEQLFVSREGSNNQFMDHLVNMQQAGVWGTEQEIAAAAHLFDCSIICYSRYSSANFCLQHFSPHFTTTANCNNTCQHHTIYLINSSGSHYETATVTLPAITNEQ